MDCQSAREHWNRVLDGEQQTPKIETHIRQCAACREYVADLEAILNGLAELRGDTETVGSLHRRFPSETVRRSRTLLRLAAMIAIIGGGYVVLIRTVPNGPSDATSERSASIAVAPSPREGITLKGNSAAALLAVAAPTTDPDVQMYWLYPRVPAATQPQGPSKQ